jgi:hypothetical protein
MILKIARFIILDYKAWTGKLKRESTYDILCKKKELPPPGQLQNQTQFIFTGLFFLIFLALVASAGGPLTSPPPDFQIALPAKLKCSEFLQSLCQNFLYKIIKTKSTARVGLREGYQRTLLLS